MKEYVYVILGSLSACGLIGLGLMGIKEHWRAWRQLKEKVKDKGPGSS